MANVAWGIDIGNRALKGVKLQRTSEGVRIVDFAFIEHDTILSESGDNRQSLIQTSLAKFVGRHDTRKTPLCIGVSGQQSFARFVKLPPVEPKKIPEIVKFEAVQQIPFPLDEVEWSYQLFQKPDDPDIEVGIFAIRKELVNERVGSFLEVDLDVHAVQTTPLAVFNAMRYDGRLDKGHSIIVDLGADSTDLVIADAESIWMRTLDIGGNNFTEALAKAFKIDFDKAEEMKRNAKTSKYAKQIYQAMRPVFGELVGEIQRSLGFFQSTHRDVQLRKVVALGGGFKLNGLSGYVQKNLQMAVEKPTKFAALPPEEPGAASALSEHVLSGAASYGLALQLLEEGKVTSSLLPMAIRKEKMWKDKTKWFGVAAGLVVGAAFVAFAGYLFNDMALSASSADEQKVNKLIADAQRLDQDWLAVTNDGSAELQQVRNVSSLVQDRSYWPMLLEEIDRVLPRPSAQMAQALQGQLGQPGVIDDADIQAIVAIPRQQREFVTVAKMESAYTHQLYNLVNNSNPMTLAEEVLGSKSPETFGGATVAGSEEAPAVEYITDPEARGYVIRLTLVTPLPYDQAIARFRDGGNDLGTRLTQITPAQRPGLPFSIPIAAVRQVRPLDQDQEMLSALTEAHEARNAMRPDLAGSTTTQPDAESGGQDAGRTPPNQPGRRPSGFGGSPRPGQTPQTGGARQPGGTGQSQAVNRDSPAFLDPITGESMLKDTVIEVIFVVHLDPPAAEEETPEDDMEGSFAGAQ